MLVSGDDLTTLAVDIFLCIFNIVFHIIHMVMMILTGEKRKRKLFVPPGFALENVKMNKFMNCSIDIRTEQGERNVWQFVLI